MRFAFDDKFEFAIGKVIGEEKFRAEVLLFDPSHHQSSSSTIIFHLNNCPFTQSEIQQVRKIIFVKVLVKLLALSSEELLGFFIDQKLLRAFK